MTDTSKIEELLDMLDRGSMVPATDYALKEAATTIRALLEREAKLRRGMADIAAMSIAKHTSKTSMAREAHRHLKETDNAG